MLIVFVGRAGTGKTTLARLLAARLGAAHLRVDAIEAAIVRGGLASRPLGPVGYDIAAEVAAGCLAVGTPVVVDAVSPVPEARAGWARVAEAAGAPLRVVELEVSDPAEHRRRVSDRTSDLVGLIVPTWEQVLGRDYQPWNERRDGPRLLVRNDSTPETALVAVLAHLDAAQ